MEPRIIKLNKKDDIATVVKKIKDLKEREVVFEMEKGAVLLSSSSNLRLMKRTGEVLGKKVRVVTSDPIGQMIAKKAEVLYQEEEAMKPIRPKVMRSYVRPKFGDILGPRRIFPLATVKSLNKKAASFIPKIPSKISIPKVSASFSKKFIFGTVVIVIAVFGLAVLLPQASITVYARSEPVTRDVEIQVDRTIRQTDFDNLKVTGQLITKEVSHTKNFSTTGVKLEGSKASGKVVVYNFTKNTIRLRSQTTTLTANGKNYFFLSDAAGIKPTVRNGQEIDVKSLTVSVAIIAVEAGEGSNLSVNTRFEIKNQALGNQDVYAISATEILGGQATSKKILSQDDYDKATAVLKEELALKVEEDLSKEVSNDIRFLPSGAAVEVLAHTANKNINEVAEDFDMTMIGRVKGLSFKENEVKAVIVEKINSVLSSDKYLLESAEQKLTAKFKSMDLNTGQGVLAIHFETMVAYKIENRNLEKILAGKNAIEIKEILLTKPEIDRVDVNFSPFFVHKAPRFNGKINIQTSVSKFETFDR